MDIINFKKSFTSSPNIRNLTRENTKETEFTNKLKRIGDKTAP